MSEKRQHKPWPLDEDANIKPGCETDPVARTAPRLVPQAHGGALLSGGISGHRGGGGRPPSVIRAAMRASLDERLGGPLHLGGPIS